MIIVEGPDGAGKTTFVEKLADRLEMDVAPRAVDHDMEAVADIKDYVESAVMRGFESVIYDRFALISGCIYDPVFTGMTGVNKDFQDFEWLQAMQTAFLQQVDPVIIWCLPPLDTVLTNLKNDHLNKAVSAQLDRVRAIYWLYHCRAALEPDPIVYDYTCDRLSDVFAEVEAELEKRDGQ